jgi:HAD superfamily hydrolase (TIGR01490 family)
MAQNKAVVFDVDETLARGWYITKFAEFLHNKGNFSASALARMNEIVMDYNNGKISYEELITVTIIFGEGISGESEADIKSLGETYIRLHPGDKMSHTDRLVSMLKERGYITVAVSGSPAEIIVPFSRSIGIRNTFATTYETKNGLYTGKLIKPMGTTQNKGSMLKEFFRKHNINTRESIGFGDSDQDVAFLGVVGKPVAVNPSRELRKIAKENGWLICERGDNVVKKVEELIS